MKAEWGQIRIAATDLSNHLACSHRLMLRGVRLQAGAGNQAATILQSSLYSELVKLLQGEMPDEMYVVPAGAEFRPEAHRVPEFAAYAAGGRSARGGGGATTICPCASRR